MIGFFKSSTIQKKKLVGLVPRCGACGLLKGCRSPKMAVYGEGRKDVLVVGEAPGEKEDLQGRPFIGKAGEYLRQALDEVDVDLDQDAWTTNAVICRPPKNRTPDGKQIASCRPNLVETIAHYHPRVVILLGRSAMAGVLELYWKSDLGSVERWAGWQIPLEAHWVCPTFHPSFLLRTKNQLMDRLFESHLRAAFALDRSPPKLPDFKQLIKISYDEDEVYQALWEINREGGWAAVDYETTCIKPEWPKGQIISCAVSNGRQTISYPWIGRAITATHSLLKSNRTQKIASNLKFEERWTLKTFGHGVRCWGWDTMLAAHCLDNRTGICSLKFQSFVKMGVPSYNEKVEAYLQNYDGPYNRITEIEPNELLFYGGMDALLEYKLAMKQRREMGYDRA